MTPKVIKAKPPGKVFRGHGPSQALPASFSLVATGSSGKKQDVQIKTSIAVEKILVDSN